MQKTNCRKSDPALDANAQAVTLDPIDVQGGGGTAGYVANNTSVATKTNTPLINIPQSLNVVTKAFIKDQSPTDVTRYVPGVAVHVGEGNRDELVIRGVEASADANNNISPGQPHTFRLSTTAKF